MIDASRSPRPAWKRFGTFALLLVLIIAAAYLIWVKELHHTALSPSTPRPPATAAAHRPSAKPTATTVPAGLAVSGRDPFRG